jgi:MFS family permease
MIDFRLLRKRNLLAANISQFLAGSIELGLGFLLPYFYLLAVGISPEAAGLALLPATVPIILAGPLAGKAYDKVGPRLPLVLGFLVLGASGVALAAATSALSPWAMIPGLLLQGAGLGVVLTVNDPTGLGAVSESDSGQAAGMLNTSEQFGGAVGIAVLGALELGYYRNELTDRLAARGLFPTADQAEQFRDFILDAEQYGLRHTPQDAAVVQAALADSIEARIPAFELTFLVTSGISLLGAVTVLILIKSGRPHHPVRVFSRRSRWVLDRNDRKEALPAAQQPGS